MQDLISRKAVLDWLNDEWDGIVLSVFDGIRALPSAQLERITLTEEERRTLKKMRTFHNGSYAKLLDKLFVSAQPERISGREVYQAGYADGYKAGQQERKTGKWIKKPEFCGDDVSGFIDNHFSCSECKKEAEINSWGFYILSDFCPHCGARLVQEGEEP